MPTKKRRYDRSAKPSSEELRDVFSDLSKDVGQLIKKLTQSGAEFFKKLSEERRPERKAELGGGLENLFKQFGAAFKETFGPLGFTTKPTQPTSKPKPKRRRKKG